jgi:hypothetical protein
MNSGLYGFAPRLRPGLRCGCGDVSSDLPIAKTGQQGESLV